MTLNQTCETAQSHIIQTLRNTYRMEALARALETQLNLHNVFLVWESPSNSMSAFYAHVVASAGYSVEVRYDRIYLRYVGPGVIIGFPETKSYQVWHTSHEGRQSLMGEYTSDTLIPSICDRWINT